MNYEFKYRLQSAPQATLDGSAMVQHDTFAISREEGSEDEWAIVPGRHKTINVPAAELQAALADAQPVQAYKNALVRNLNTMPVPISGWDTASLESLMDANDASGEAGSAADEYITVTLGLSYPVDFSL